jgi:hypothetical protein
MLAPAGKPTPLFYPFVIGTIAFVNWYFEGSIPLTYFLGGVAIALAISDVIIFIGTGGRGE